MRSGGIRRSGISAPGPSNDAGIRPHRQHSPVNADALSDVVGHTSASATVEVIDRTGLDTDQFPFRVGIEGSFIVLGGKMRSRTAAGEQIVGDFKLSVVLRDGAGRELRRVNVPVRHGELGLWYTQPIARPVGHPGAQWVPEIDLSAVVSVVISTQSLKTAESLARESRREDEKRESEERQQREKREGECLSSIRRQGWPQEVQERVSKREIWIGMSDEQARLSIGSPQRIHESITAAGRREVWAYPGPLRLYFDGGRVVEIQRTR